MTSKTAIDSVLVSLVFLLWLYCNEIVDYFFGAVQ